MKELGERWGLIPNRERKREGQRGKRGWERERGERGLFTGPFSFSGT